MNVAPPGTRSLEYMSIDWFVAEGGGGSGGKSWPRLGSLVIECSLVFLLAGNGFRRIECPLDARDPESTRRGGRRFSGDATTIPAATRL